MQHDICAFGDYLIDFTPLPQPGNSNSVLEMNVGGTSANLSACCARLGLSVLAVGKVGQDALGQHIIDLLAASGVNISGLMIDDEGRATTQSLVSLCGGERSFSFFRKYAADIRLSLEELNLDEILASRVLAFTGMSFNDEPIRTASFALLKAAQKRGILTAIDVNYRKNLWDNEEKFTTTMASVVPHLHFYKSSEEEALMIAAASTVPQAAEIIMGWGPRLVVISCGAKGAYFRCAHGEGHRATFDTLKVDTTGAGDCFFGAMLHQLLLHSKYEPLDTADMEEMVDFANAAGAVSISCRGGVASMPELEQVKHCLCYKARLETP